MSAGPAIMLADRVALYAALGFTGTCGRREEYGRGGGVVSDRAGLCLLCRDEEDQVLLLPSSAGVPLARYDLPASWAKLGPLAQEIRT